MADLDLPTIAPDAEPEFTDASGCAKWLQTVPLINVGPAHVRLLEQLDELNSFKLAPGERLKILELMREPVNFVQKELAKKFASRPAPLAPPEREVLKNVQALWDALSTGYQHCVQAIVDRAGSLSVALVGQRVLWCIGQKMVTCYEAYQDVGEAEWRTLHRVYALVEERGKTKEEVAHPDRKGKETTCMETYAQVLLLDLANPGKLTPRQIELISQWLERWTRKVSIGRESADTGDAAPLTVDLSSTGGASHRPVEGDSARILDLSELRSDLRKRIALLRKGETPAELGLGEDVTAALADSMLVMIYRRWCEDKQSRAHPRHGATGTAQTCVGMQAIHYFVSGRAFTARSSSRPMSTKEHMEMATLGRLATARQDDDPSTTPNFPLETWQIKDESASGLRLERVDPRASSRLVLGQLLGIRLADAKAFLLCTIKWLSVSTEFGLRIGVQILPGVPHGIAVKPAGASADPYVQGFLLPAFAPLQAPETLVTPAGTFKPKREIEIADRPGRVRLLELIDRGADFERVSFEAA
jgi:cyclic-di-GMP-binding protein